MIVSSIPRSGSTKYCSDLANKLGYRLLDEAFNINIEAKHKNEIHELKLDVVYPKTVEFLKTVDFNTVVVNNHDTTWFNLVHTDIFVSRQNVQDSIWSYVAFIEKMMRLLPSTNVRQIHMPVLCLGLPDKFIEHGDHETMLAECGLDATGIIKAIEQKLT